MVQIEQFIETLFPSQDVRKIKAVQEAEKTQGDSNSSSSSDFWDAVSLIAVTLIALLLVSATMVCTVLAPPPPCIPFTSFYVAY